MQKRGFPANRMVLHLGTLKPILRPEDRCFAQSWIYCQLLSGSLAAARNRAKDFVLYGGTALALRLGHRQSVDFDFFCNEVFAPEQLFSAMNLPRDSRVDQRGDNTLSVFVNEVKLSFFGDVRMNRVHDPDVAENGLQVASLLDLIGHEIENNSAAGRG